MADLLPIVQIVPNSVPSPHRGDVAPMIYFTGMSPLTGVRTFVRSSSSSKIIITDVQRERAFTNAGIQKLCDDINPVVQATPHYSRAEDRLYDSRGKSPKFIEGAFVLVTCSESNAGEKLSFSWRLPRGIVKKLSDCVYQAEELRTGSIAEAHSTRVKFYPDESLNDSDIISHVLTSETGTTVQRLMRLVEESGGFNVQVC